MECPKCFWHDYYKICPICDNQIPEERNCAKEGFLWCHDCVAITHKNAKTLETNFCSPSKEENEERINQFSFLSNRFVFDSFCHWLLIKLSKRYLVSDFIASNYYSRVSVDPCKVILHCFNNNTSRCSLGVFPIELN